MDNYYGNYNQGGYTPNQGYNNGYNNYNYNQPNYNRNTTGNYMGDEYKPIRAIGYVGYMWLFAIPIIGFICLLVFAFSDKNINRRNFARSYFLNFFICLLIGLIVLIPLMMGVGALVISTSNDVASEAVNSVNSAMVGAFNGQFETYFGNDRTKAEVRNLINKVNENNSNTSIENKVTIVGDRTTIEQLDDDSNVQSYNISAGGHDKNGYINKISITI